MAVARPLARQPPCVAGVVTFFALPLVSPVLRWSFGLARPLSFPCVSGAHLLHPHRHPRHPSPPPRTTLPNPCTPSLAPPHPPAPTLTHTPTSPVLFPHTTWPTTASTCSKHHHHHQRRHPRPPGPSPLPSPPGPLPCRACCLSVLSTLTIGPSLMAHQVPEAHTGAERSPRRGSTEQGAAETCCTDLEPGGGVWGRRGCF